MRCGGIEGVGPFSQRIACKRHRVICESFRVIMESPRVTRESQRVIYESLRVTTESLRVVIESMGVTEICERVTPEDSERGRGRPESGRGRSFIMPHLLGRIAPPSFRPRRHAGC